MLTHPPCTSTVRPFDWVCGSCTGGVYLGDSRNIYCRVFVRGVTQEVITFAENTGTFPEHLAVNLLMALFTPEQIRNGNRTKPCRDDISQLDSTRIHPIRGTLCTYKDTIIIDFNLLFSLSLSLPSPNCTAHINYRFPIEEKESARWKSILQEKLNAKCRGMREQSQ